MASTNDSKVTCLFDRDVSQILKELVDLSTVVYGWPSGLEKPFSRRSSYRFKSDVQLKDLLQKMGAEQAGAFWIDLQKRFPHIRQLSFHHAHNDVHVEAKDERDSIVRPPTEYLRHGD